MKGARSIILALCIVMCSCGVASSGSRRVVVVIADGLDLTLASKAGTALADLVHNGSCALVSSRTADVSNAPVSSALTAGSGTRMIALEASSVFAYPQTPYMSETAGTAYSRRSGIPLSHIEAHSVVAPGWFELSALNDASPYRGKPGLLGESLARADLMAAVVLPEISRKPAASTACLLAADSKGVVNFADVQPNLAKSEPAAATGHATDPHSLAQSIARAFSDPRVALVVVECNDVAWHTSEEGSISDRLRPVRLKAAHVRVSKVLQSINKVVQGLSGDAAVVVLSFRGPSGLGLMAAKGPGLAQGLLTSATTRRPGLITLADVAPTLLSMMGVAPSWPALGSPAAPTPADGVFESLIELENAVVNQETARGPSLKVFTGVLITTIAICTASALLRRSRLALLSSAAKAMLVASCVSPAALIAAPALGFHEVGSILAWQLAFCAGIGILAAMARVSAAGAVETASAVTSIMIVADVMAGGRLASESVLGFSAMIGARFYGLGNELMGVLIGSSVVGACALWRVASHANHRRRLWALPAITCVAATILLGNPSHGANFGGMIAAAITAWAAATIGVRVSGHALQSRAAWRRAWMAWAAAMLLIVAALAYLNTAAGTTHIARAVSLASSPAGLSELVAIAMRKIAMNAKLMRYTSWTQLLWAYLVSVSFLAVREHGLFRSYRLAQPQRYVATLSSLVGAAAALIANDSGVAACATTAMMPTLLLLGYAADEGWGWR